jgi:NDP-sugar pyrophosphorylase family protein
MEKIAMKKFELTTDKIKSNGVTLHRIKALIDFGDVKAGEWGGYVEKETNLSQYGGAWVYTHAQVYGNAQVFGQALVYGNAQVFGNARICSDAKASGNARIFGNARISGNAHIFGDSLVYGNACMCDNAQVSSDADYICLKGFGSRNRNTTMFRTENGNICVSCGCFIGSLQEFENKVKETHGNNKFAKEYLALVEAAKIHFEV